MQQRHTDRERYFHESSCTSLEYYIPYIEQFHGLHKESKVLEIGCGEGGNLLPFAKKGCHVTGIDICEGRIQQAKTYFKKAQIHANFLCYDFLLYSQPKEEHEKFDIILLHDVIEHITDKHKFIGHILQFMKHDGILFVAFPAWQMPFGGHQQICRNSLWSKIPFYHLLPTKLYRFILQKLAHEETNTIEELLDIKKCKTSIELFESIVRQRQIRIVNRQLWLINPHYLKKFGLKPRKLNLLISKLPYFRNYLSTSCFYLLTPIQDEKASNLELRL